MDAPPPLSLSVLSLSPAALHTPAAEPAPLPAAPTTPPPLPPAFALSPSPSYAPPYPAVLLGQTVALELRLANTSDHPVAGVKTMLELQSPTARTRLVEVIHGQAARDEGTAPDALETRAYDDLPRLAPGESLGVAGALEVKELGAWVAICSVAWETRDGRRTLQRFLKFTVTPPFAIKTRVHAPSHPDAALSPMRRARVSLEVLVQNTAAGALGFASAALEPVRGLEVCEGGGAGPLTSLMPGDTTQFLFVLQPSADAPTDPADPAAPAARLQPSLFLPRLTPGSLAPLGRLDVAYVHGPHHEPGRLQTSTLSRRVPVTPAPALARAASSIGGWDVDVVVLDGARAAAAEAEWALRVRVAVRAPPGRAGADADAPPAPPALAVQYLAPTPAPAAAPAAPAPHALLSPPRAHSAAPPSPGSPSRALSPAPSQSAPMTPGPSRLSAGSSPGARASPQPPFAPLAPLAPLAALPRWPPPPELARRPPPPAHTGRVAPLGHSLVRLPALALHPAAEPVPPGYEPDPAAAAPARLEAAAEVELRFLALAEGMCELGGLRVLALDEAGGGEVWGEWLSLGDVWIA